MCSLQRHGSHYLQLFPPWVQLGVLPSLLAQTWPATEQTWTAQNHLVKKWCMFTMSGLGSSEPVPETSVASAWALRGTRINDHRENAWLGECEDNWGAATQARWSCERQGRSILQILTRIHSLWWRPITVRGEWRKLLLANFSTSREAVRVLGELSDPSTQSG